MGRLPSDPFDRTHLPDELRDATALDMTASVAWVREVATELLGGHRASAAARLFVGAAITRWLEEGHRGDLETFLRLRPVRGCHLTAQVIARRLQDNFTEA